MNEQIQPTALDVFGVANRYAISAATVRRWNASGNFPRPIRVGSTCRWLVSVLEKWENGFNAVESLEDEKCQT